MSRAPASRGGNSGPGAGVPHSQVARSPNRVPPAHSCPRLQVGSRKESGLNQDRPPLPGSQPSTPRLLPRPQHSLSVPESGVCETDLACGVRLGGGGRPKRTARGRHPHPWETACGPRTLEKVVLRVHVGVVGDDVEGRASGHHLKHQDAQCPPVHTEPWGDGTGAACGRSAGARPLWGGRGARPQARLWLTRGWVP